MKIKLFLLLFLVLLSSMISSRAQDQTYQEAPMLTEKVQQGLLPPVQERLPKHPRVFPVYEEIGQYGGTLHGAYKGLSDRYGPTKLIEERIVEFQQPTVDNIEIVNGYIDDFKVNDDSSVFTFTLKEGLRWSDGILVTTRDVQFWYEDIFLNTDLTPSISNLYRANNIPLSIEIVDDLTFKVKFEGSYPLFPEILAKESTGAPGLDRPGFIQPFHYLSQFHPQYAKTEDLLAAVTKYAVADWTQLWGEDGPVQSWWLNPDLPVITPWKIVVPPPAEVILMERNPYYYGVDTAGNQLPYIDYVEYQLIEVNDFINLMVAEGKIDAQGRHITNDLAFLEQNAEAGDYRIMKWKEASTMTIFPNLNTQDEVLRTLFEDIRFREALNIAIDLQTLNDVFFSGLREPRQASPISGSPYYDSIYETLWMTYDSDRANALLDEVGLATRDEEGFRLRPDGKRLSLTIEVYGPDTILSFVQLSWTALGIETNIHVWDDRDAFEAYRADNSHQMFFDTLDRSSIVSSDSRRYLGFEACADQYFLWWDSNGLQGIEPPKDHWIRQAWTAWEQAQSAHTQEEARAFVQEIITINRENNCFIGTLGEDPVYYVVKNNVRNFPDGLINDDILRSPGNANPQQWFFIKEAE
jgi:peptide/nickel transport system substrate-binding protein